MVSEYVSKVGDIRVGFNVLSSGAFIAEQQGKDHIDKDAVIAAGKIAGFSLR